MPRNALGKGLSALIREPEPLSPPQAPQQAQAAPTQQVPQAHPTFNPPMATTAVATAAAPALSEGLFQVDIDLIEPSPYQPRTRFREEALEELAQSIATNGIIQPLVLRAIGSRYQLIAGERRWRAAQRAGLRRVPSIVRDVPEELALEITLVENIQ